MCESWKVEVGEELLRLVGRRLKGFIVSDNGFELAFEGDLVLEVFCIGGEWGLEVRPDDYPSPPSGRGKAKRRKKGRKKGKQRAKK